MTKDTSKTHDDQLQQFCLLAKTAHGAALCELIRQVLEMPSIYVFGELLEMQNVQELKNGPHKVYFDTLHLFAYGTYKQYRLQPTNYLELNAAMQKKLQHLTIVSLAIKSKSIPYSVLLEELDINNVRHLEDVIIEAIYADIIHGKLFQNTRILEIDYVKGRDIPEGFTNKIVQTLQQWVDSCDAVSQCIVSQIALANSEKAKRLRVKERVESEVSNMRKLLILSGTDKEEAMQIDARESSTSTSQEARKKSCKAKNARTTAGRI